MLCWAYSHNNSCAQCLVILGCSHHSSLICSEKGPMMLCCDSEIENSMRRVGSGAYVEAQQVSHLVASPGPIMPLDLY